MARRLLLAVLLLGLLAAGCSHTRSRPAPVPVRIGAGERGIASWYGEPFHGRRTASGEVYDMHGMTAAHRSLPFATVVRVTRRDTGASVEVRINDRGPFVRGRIIDLSYAAACAIGLDRDGVAPVELEIISRRGKQPPIPAGSLDQVRGTCLWVQVGAFSVTRNAERARQRLLAGGEQAVISEGPGGLSRVRVGPMSSAEQASQVHRRLLRQWPEAKVVSCGG
jgi:rare lipoprotein A